jgi:hypothetical protein
MQVAAFRRDAGQRSPDRLDREEFIRSMASLREDVSSMSTDVRQVLDENVELKQELRRLKARRRSQRSNSELRRLKQQLDQLIDLHESALDSDRGRGRELCERPERVGIARTNGSWMTKMMMFMMLSELA